MTIIGSRFPMPSGLFPYEPSFHHACLRIREQTWFTEEWICKCGPWSSATAPQYLVLKLLKRRWSDDDPAAIGNKSGIFFSMWIDANDPAQLRFNIHALKLRGLKGYTLASRKFATDFRSAFAPLGSSWPKYRTNFGPQTLIEGLMLTPPKETAKLLVSLAAKFAEASIVIDRLLDAAKKPMTMERF